MKIAVCDDCQEDIRYLRKLIKENEYCQKDLELSEYLSGNSLLADFKDFDAIFLDILMRKGMDGIQTAENIRRRDFKVPIIFYTAYETPASWVFGVGGYDYLLKSLSEEKLALRLHRILKEAAGRIQEKKLVVECAGNLLVLPLSDILYISIYNKGTLIWLTEEKAGEYPVISMGRYGKAIKSHVRLADYYQELKQWGFLYANRSYIVNAEHVAVRSKDTIQLEGGVILNVSRGKKRQFNEDFSRYLKIKHGREN